MGKAPRSPHSVVPIGDGNYAAVIQEVGADQEPRASVNRRPRQSRHHGIRTSASTSLDSHSLHRQLQNRRPSRSSSTGSVGEALETSSSASGAGRMSTRRGRVNTAAFPRAYEFEWHDSQFFEGREPEEAGQVGGPPTPEEGGVGIAAHEHRRAPSVSRAAGRAPLKSPGVVSSPGPESVRGEWMSREIHKGSDQLKQETLTIGKLKAKMDRLVLMEVAAGTHQLVEVSATEVMHRVRAHKLDQASLRYLLGQHKDNGEEVPLGEGKYIGPSPPTHGRRQTGDRSPKRQTIGELTYRDIRQVFTEGKASPSIEVRRNCIVVCLPPVIALVLHDRVVFMVHDELDTDALLLKLEEITAIYAKRSEAILDYYVREHQPGSRARRRQAASSPFIPKLAALSMSPSHGMLFGAGSMAELASPDDSDEPTAQVPRYVSFPLEFAILEILMSFAFEIYQRELEEMESTLQKVEKKVTRKTPNAARLELLHDVKTPCQEFQDNIAALAEAFRDLLTSPEDMAHMELTRLFFRPEKYIADGEESMLNANLEILLEFFDQEVSQFDRRVRALVRAIDNMEKLLTLRMALTRNAIVYYELAGTIMAVFMGAGTCISGVFGMNLLSTLEESHLMFTLMVSLVAALFAIGIILVIWMVFQNRFA